MRAAEIENRRLRTAEILQRHENAVRRSTDGPVRTTAQAINLERLLRETVRLLREHKTVCVREEHAAVRLLLGDESPEGAIDVGYGQVKAEIDEAVERLLQDKVELRMLRARLAPKHDTEVPTSPRPGPASTHHLQQLVELHQVGVLNLDEFNAAKARLF